MSDENAMAQMRKNDSWDVKGLRWLSASLKFFTLILAIPSRAVFMVAGLVDFEILRRRTAARMRRTEHDDEHDDVA